MLHHLSNVDGLPSSPTLMLDTTSEDYVNATATTSSSRIKKMTTTKKEVIKKTKKDAKDSPLVLDTTSSDN